jgi:precorrin-4/cobalt-precorrin-4 C11-methyltransferase
MTVHFIGAGPGAADLITLRGMRLIQQCPVVLYAGSLVPEEILSHAADDALIIDSAPLHLDEIMAHIEQAHKKGHNVARIHSGDPSIYGAIGEQIRRLEAADIDYVITPGVPAFAAAAALLGKELTLPNVSQSIILTRTARKSSDMPEGEDLVTLGKSGATLAIHLSLRNLKQVEEALLPNYGADCPVAVVYKASWPDEQVLKCTLGTLREALFKSGIKRTALIMVGHVLDQNDFDDSHLYHKDHPHYLRPKNIRKRK